MPEKIFKSEEVETSNGVGNKWKGYTVFPSSAYRKICEAS